MDWTVTRARCKRSSALWGKGTRSGDAPSAKHRSAGVVAVILAAALVLVAPATALAKGKPEQKDTKAPETRITNGPGNLALVTGPVTFTFSVNEAATVECSVDGSPWGACTTPTSFTLIAPAAGTHTFTVRATDTAGNVETRPPTVQWISGYASAQAYLPSTLLAQAKATPTKIFDVIVQLRRAPDVNKVATMLRSNGFGSKPQIKQSFRSIQGFNAKLPGWLVLYLAESYPVVAITPNAKVQLDDAGGLAPVQTWQKAIEADALWPSAVADLTAPTIAIVDSGIDGSRTADFGGRLIGHVNLSPEETNVDDGDGHGTFVASIAAGEAASYPGVAPTAKLFDVRAMNDEGTSSASDVIAAADWILAHKDEYNIKVANFSLHTARPNSFRFDPLDRAVESLWFNGVTVVAAAGNFGVGLDTPQKMFFAPGNDPFVITVGAADTKDTEDVADDDVAFWSAFGYTADGFGKPEVVAPGRYMIGAVPKSSTIATERADKIVAPGYVKISGTSFAAPAVAGAAANLAALHPAWGPDEIKGALMLTARRLTGVPQLAQGFGEIDEAAAGALAAAPNPNAGLDRFVTSDASVAGGRSFDGTAWTAAAESDPAWNDMAWTDMAWTDMAWTDMAWTDMAWTDMAWTDMAWTDMAWTDGSRVD
jgi:serine protease AprX